jgi:hypothetical protein
MPGKGPHIRKEAIMRYRKIATAFGLAVACLAVGVPAVTAAPVEYSPGAPGIGDSYFPLEGNGGYDVQHYDLGLSYDPVTDRLDALNKSRRGRRRISRALISTSSS